MASISFDEATPAERFAFFLTILQPTSEDHKYASQVHKALRELINRAEEVEKTLLSGSVRRHTAINPLHDVDIFIVLKKQFIKPNIPYTNLLMDILERVVPGKWEDTDDNNTRCVKWDKSQMFVRKQKASVGVSLGKSWGERGITFDLVPAIENTHGSYTIYKRRAGTMHSNPDAARDRVIYFNDQWNGAFSNLVRLIKKWNQINGLLGEDGMEKPFKSFHIEVLCYKFADTYNWNGDIRKAVTRFFDFLVKNFAEEMVVPGVQDQRLKIDTTGIWKKKDIKRVVKLASQNSMLADTAENQREYGQANSYWVKVFGKEY